MLISSQMFIMSPRIFNRHIQISSLIIIYAALSVTLVWSLNKPSQAKDRPGVLMLFIDGFRWDYIHKKELAASLPNLSMLKKQGLYVKQMKPVFPADCYPNILSMFTGVHAGSHGIFANRLFDAQTNQHMEFVNSETKTMNYERLKHEPLWVTAKKNGIKIFSYNFPICNESTSANSTHFCSSYKKQLELDEWMKYAERAVDVLSSVSCNLAIVYFDELDYLTHQYGPNSQHLEQILLPKLDEKVGILWKRLMNPNSPQHHLLIVSDHGMTLGNKEIYLNRLIGKDVKVHINHGTYVHVWPEEKKHEYVYCKLKDSGEPIDVYYRDEVPEIWRVSHHEQFPPILVVAHSGHFFKSKNYPVPEVGSESIKAFHGYTPDNLDMHTPLLLVGPDIPSIELENASVVEIYPLLCHLLNMTSFCGKHEAAGIFVDHINSHMVREIPPKSSASQQSIMYILIFWSVFVNVVFPWYFRSDSFRI